MQVHAPWAILPESARQTQGYKLAMTDSPRRLAFVYDGWDGYHRSLVAAVAPLTPDQLAFRGAAEMRSVGELAWHIADGRVDWFRRMNAPGSAELAAAMEARGPAPTAPFAATEIVEWLERTWGMIQATLDQWSVDDLAVTYRHPYNGQVYAVSHQWTLWRILLHDVHHGGQLSELLALQGILPAELTWLGGHLTVPALAPM
jgi:uncharacterized damage-inducible protein DinB